MARRSSGFLKVAKIVVKEIDKSAKRAEQRARQEEAQQVRAQRENEREAAREQREREKSYRDREKHQAMLEKEDIKRQKAFQKQILQDAKKAHQDRCDDRAGLRARFIREEIS